VRGGKFQEHLYFPVPEKGKKRKKGRDQSKIGKKSPSTGKKKTEVKEGGGKGFSLQLPKKEKRDTRNKEKENGTLSTTTNWGERGGQI